MGGIVDGRTCREISILGSKEIWACASGLSSGVSVGQIWSHGRYRDCQIPRGITLSIKRGVWFDLVVLDVYCTAFGR
jgi:hypothetical protein